MPQKRNPDVFELVRGRSAVAQAALNEVLGITQKLTSGYHRDLQLIKAPLFRGIDSCLQTLDILPAALDGVRFVRAATSASNDDIHAAAEANALVVEGGNSVPRGLPARRGQAAQGRKPDAGGPTLEIAMAFAYRGRHEQTPTPSAAGLQPGRAGRRPPRGQRQ